VLREIKKVMSYELSRMMYFYEAAHRDPEVILKKVASFGISYEFKIEE
jgi:hypothetical protein